jgi:hypothetical protein
MVDMEVGTEAAMDNLLVDMEVGMEAAMDNLLVDTPSSSSSKANTVNTGAAVWVVRACLLLVIIQSSALYLNPVLTRLPPPPGAGAGLLGGLLVADAVDGGFDDDGGDFGDF